MKIGSLFAGIGGLELGLERAIPGAETIWQVEKDPYARRVLAKHWPAAKRYEDVRQVGAHNLERPDLLVGGFPCQDISNAGRKAGIDGERSGLWSEFARIIGEIRPRYVVLENVSAVVNRGMGRVLGQLAASGYDAVWDCIHAAAIGAPHLRDRWFCIAWLADSDSGRLEGQWEPEHGQQQGARRDQLDGCYQRRRGPWKDPTSGAISNAFRNGLRQQSRRIFWQERQGQAEPGNHGATESLADADSGRREVWWKDGRMGRIGIQSVNKTSPERFAAWQAEPGLGIGSDGLSAGLDGPRVAPWEQGIPRTVQGRLPDRVARLRCLGNAVVPQVAEVVGRVVWQIEQSTEREQ